jgi:hypothetical protein
MLATCNNNHEDICYEGAGRCPLCCALAEKIQAEIQRDSALGEAEKLQLKVEQLLK